MRTGEKYSNIYAGNANNTVTIKKNQVPYNYVTQAQCVSLSEGMTSVDGTDTNKLNGTKVFTKLCSSYSWDTAINFIQKTHPAYGSTSKTKEGVAVGNYPDHLYSESKGLLNTGKTLAVCSIYDMGGNVWEFSTERCTDEDGTCVIRGWSFDYTSLSDVYSPAERNNCIDMPYDNTAFRPTLFVR